MARTSPSGAFSARPSQDDDVQVAPAPLVVEAAAPLLGDSASSDRLRQLASDIRDLKAQAARPALKRALDAVKAGEWQTGAEWALKVLDADDKNGHAWWLLAICREKMRDVVGSISCFEAALKLLPDHTEIANDLGRLAFSLGYYNLAIRFFHHFLAGNPGHVDGSSNLAAALRRDGRYDEAIEVLRGVILANPENAQLWNNLGTVLSEQGESEQALTFFDEALRQQPNDSRARHNRSNARIQAGDVAGALEDLETAIPGAPTPRDGAMMRFAYAQALIACGQLERGWEEYEVRFDENFETTVRFLVNRPRWTPETDLSGKTLLVVGEQGLGDEVLFANVLPEVVSALGRDGRLILAVEERLQPLFARSFPDAEIGRHATTKQQYLTFRAAITSTPLEEVDVWTPIGSLLRRFRTTIDSFPDRSAFLQADPARVAYWRGQLDSLGAAPKAGVLWKSLLKDADRSRYFSPFEQWRRVLRTPGVTFVNLQYGDCSEELAQAEAAGIPVWNPPGIDLKNDLDDVAALTCALDVVIAPPNATSNIAAACGVPTWLICTPGAWPLLGTQRYPWYPTVRAFLAPKLNSWETVMGEVAGALRTTFPAKP